VPSTVVRTVDQRILEAAAVLPPDHGGVTGWAGLRWAGGYWFDGTGANAGERAVVLAVGGDNVRSQPGIAVSHERLDPRDLTVIDGLRLTNVVRCVWFEMRYAVDVRAAAVVLSMAAYSDLVSIDELACFAALHRGWTGAPRCREAVGLAEENAWSPMELEVALVWSIDAALPPLLCNRALFDRRGKLIGTPDLLDVEAGLAIEYDGAHHAELRRRVRDASRSEAFRRHGIETLSVLAPHLQDRSELVRRMHEARGRARFEAESARSWTAVPPSWWVPTHTVALRRALSDEERARVLGYRLAA
jgi:very-short-patch-repair endonuclease